MSFSCIDDWLGRVGPESDGAALLRHYDQAMHALWERAQPVLGEVTLDAVGERILSDAADQYGFLALLRLDKGGISSSGLDGRAAAMPDASLREGLRYTLVEFLRVIGALTGNILTPALQAELLKLPAARPNGHPHEIRQS